MNLMLTILGLICNSEVLRFFRPRSFSSLCGVMFSSGLVFFPPAGSGAVLPSDDRPPELYRQARHAMAEGNYRHAHKLLERLLEQDSVYSPVFETLPILYVYEQRHVSGIGFFKKQILTGKHIGESQGALAILYHFLKDTLQSYNYSKLAVENSCRTVWPYEIFVQKSILLGKAQTALDSLMSRLRQNPDNWRLSYALAALRTNRNMALEADSILTELLRNGERHWKIYYLLGTNLTYLSSAPEALKIYAEGIAACRRNAEHEGLARLLEGRANAEFSGGDIGAAERSLHEGFSLARQVGNRQLEYALRSLQGQILMRQNEWESARNALYEVKRSAEEFADGRSLLTASYYLGQLERDLGKWSEATSHFLRAYAIADSLGMTDFALQLFYSLSVVDLSVGRKLQALERFLAYEQELTKKGSDLHRRALLRNIGEVLIELERYDEALPYLDKALRWRDFNSQHRVTLLTLRGTALSKLGMFREAERVLKQAERLAGRTGFDDTSIRVRLALADHYLRRNQIKRAQIHLVKVATNLSNTPPYLLFLRSMNLLAEAAIRDHDHGLATTILQSAVKAIEEHAQRVSLGSPILLTDEERDIFFGLSRTLAGAGRYEEALNVTERARDLVVRRRLLQVTLLKNKGRLDGASGLARLDSLLLLSRLRLASSEGKNLSELEARVRTLEIEREKVLTSALAGSKMRPSGDDSLSLISFRQTLDRRDEMAVSYFVGDSISLAFQIARNGVKCSVIPSGHRDLDQLVTRIHPAVRTDGSKNFDPYVSSLDTAAALAAYRLLLGPLLRDRSEKSLIIVPDDVLHALPFDLLMLPSLPNGGPQYVVRSYSIRYGTSLSSLQQQSGMQQRVSHFLMVADVRYPQMENPGRSKRDQEILPLPGGREELEAVGNIARIHTELSGREACRKNFFTELVKADWVHIASHSRSRPGEPLYAEILLSAPGANEAPDKVFAFEIFNMSLQAKTAILSGCETAQGSLLNGEGFESYVHAFRAAGTPSVIASLWKVEDRAAALFFKKYYENLRAGMSSAKSLQEAKLYMMDEEGFDATAWAAFNYYGIDWQVYHEHPARRRLGFAFAFLILVGLSAVVLLTIKRAKSDFRHWAFKTSR